MKIREMKRGDVGIISIGHYDKYIVMRSYSNYDADNTRKIALYILGSNGAFCAGDAFDFDFYVRNMDMELDKILNLKFDPSIFD